MAKLEQRSDRMLFAPLIWRLALKIEQAPWREVASSASEAAYVLRAAQRLFRQDIHCVSFDTWLEAEAIGMHVERDRYGAPVGTPGRIAGWPSVDRVLSANPVVRTVETLRRLALDADGIVPVAAITAGTTLQKRIYAPATPDSLDYIRQILLGLTRLYCEAGAGALLLLDEERDSDPAALNDYAAVFNLAAYFATPVFLLSRAPMLPETAAAAQAAGVHCVTPGRVSEGVMALPAGGGDAVTGQGSADKGSADKGSADKISAGKGPAGDGWIAMSAWEVDPDTDPGVVQAWRQQIIRN